MNDASTLVPGSYYQPSELLNIFRNFLTHKEINMTLVCLKGVYVKSDKIYGPIAYDHLKDETGSDGITIIVPVTLRDTLKMAISSRYMVHWTERSFQMGTYKFF